MAKAKTATDETPETTERAARGTGIPTQAKELVVAVANELNGVGGSLDGQNLVEVVISEATRDWLVSLGATIMDSQTRGLTSEAQLVKAQTEQNEIYVRASEIGLVDGKFAFASEVDEDRNGVLTVKIKGLKAKIAKAKESAEAGEAEPENDTPGQAE